MADSSVPDSLLDPEADMDPDVDPDMDTDADMDIASAMGFSGFGSQPKPKKRKPNNGSAVMSMSAASGSNMVPLAKGQARMAGKGRGMHELSDGPGGITTATATAFAATPAMGRTEDIEGQRLGQGPGIQDNQGTGVMSTSAHGLPTKPPPPSQSIIPTTNSLPQFLHQHHQHHPFSQPDHHHQTHPQYLSDPQNLQFQTSSQQSSILPHHAARNPTASSSSSYSSSSAKLPNGDWNFTALRHGVPDENGDMAYYMKSFVEDPWRDLVDGKNAA